MSRVNDMFMEEQKRIRIQEIDRVRLDDYETLCPDWVKDALEEDEAVCYALEDAENNSCLGMIAAADREDYMELFYLEVYGQEDKNALGERLLLRLKQYCREHNVNRIVTEEITPEEEQNEKENMLVEMGFIKEPDEDTYLVLALKEEGVPEEWELDKMASQIVPLSEIEGEVQESLVDLLIETRDGEGLEPVGDVLPECSNAFVKDGKVLAYLLVTRLGDKVLIEESCHTENMENLTFALVLYALEKLGDEVLYLSADNEAAEKISASEKFKNGVELTQNVLKQYIWSYEGENQVRSFIQRNETTQLAWNYEAGMEFMAGRITELTEHLKELGMQYEMTMTREGLPGITVHDHDLMDEYEFEISYYVADLSYGLFFLQFSTEFTLPELKKDEMELCNEYNSRSYGVNFSTEGEKTFRMRYTAAEQGNVLGTALMEIMIDYFRIERRKFIKNL